MIRTKIVATMGPATADPQVLRRLFEAGVDVCRLNFSHGDLAAHARMLDTIRQAAQGCGHPVAVLGDLCGPKIRLGKVADVNGTGGMPVAVGEELVIARGSFVGENGRVSCTYPGLIDDLKVGDRVLVEDGLLRFICTDRNYAEVRCQCTVGGVLKSAKGINLPNTHVNVPSITDRDWECADWAIEHDLDYLALSFVRSAKDLHLLREHLRNRVSDIHLVSKIEKSEAVADIDAIIEASDGLMVARGDLGVEMDLAQVPIIQKDLVRRCRVAGKPVIVATQMLQSMIAEATPTRAEVSDVANAIFDGTDAVMLSGETSVGKFPVIAVHTMAHVAKQTEDYLTSAPEEDERRRRQPRLQLKNMHLSAAVAHGVWQMVHDLKVRLVVVWSQTGSTARIFSKNRFSIPIVALSSDRRALRRMALHFGVVPYEMSPPPDMDALVARVDQLVQAKGLAAPGDRIVVVAGSSLGTPSTMNSVVIHTVGEIWQDDGGGDAGDGVPAAAAATEVGTA
jgi:pyruvate kinase